MRNEEARQERALSYMLHTVMMWRVMQDYEAITGPSDRLTFSGDRALSPGQIECLSGGCCVCSIYAKFSCASRMLGPRCVSSM